ncbi:pyridoxal phosphate-dependent aminotransferase [Pseudoponticoccus marisrubri]|uniref:Aminotransferase n=1 Tax=Pseudoponticoccus marisrubri TaxID=1685382 RepID=A0A0W7WEL9_9RHOB|nr:pyridoxal phosphate-dependent aminotransferase [Pseudoponticoccus marisrubri]KUF08994.1 aspartate aminotransferase [Pseudoponticoccus marisrubri]
MPPPADGSATASDEWFFSRAAQRLKASATNATSQRARELRAEGRDIIALSAGEPDFDTPAHIRRAASDAMQAGHTRYTNVGGVPELKDAIRAKFLDENGLRFERSEVMASTGGKQVIANALLATINAGDEVIVPAPYWVSYPELVSFCGGTPVTVPTSARNGFLITAEELEAAITPRTKWLMLNSPCNPSGAVYHEQRLSELAAVLERHPQVHVLSDDIYEHLIYSDAPFRTLASVAPGLAGRILTMNGVSKAYSMTGWRIGFAGGPAKLIKVMEKIQGQTTSCPNAIAQWATIAALTGPKDFLAERRASFRERRDLVVSRINAIDGLECLTPDGAFYVYPSCEGLLGRVSPAGRTIDSDRDFAEALLEEANVAVVFGEAFGLAGHFRISYASPTAQLSEACDRIEAFCVRTSYRRAKA